MINRRAAHSLKLVHWLFVLLLLTAVPADAEETLTLGVAAVAEFTPAFVAASKGFFKQHHLDVTLQIVPNSSTLLPALLADSVQVGGPPAPVFLQAIDQGLPIACFAAGSLADPTRPVGAVVAPPSSAIASPADLAGKRLAVSGVNSIMQILLRQWLLDRHFDPSKTTYVEVPFSRMQDTLRSGSVDAVVAVEPFVSRMKADGSGKIVIDYYRDVPDGTLSTGYCASRQWAASHRAAIADLVAALRDGADVIVERPSEARDILAHSLNLPPAIAANLPFGKFDFTLRPAEIAWWIQTLRDQHLLDTPLTPDDVILRLQ